MCEFCENIVKLGQDDVPERTCIAKDMRNGKYLIAVYCGKPFKREIVRDIENCPMCGRELSLENQSVWRNPNADKLGQYRAIEQECIKRAGCGLRELIDKWCEFYEDIEELDRYRRSGRQDQTRMEEKPDE